MNRLLRIVQSALPGTGIQFRRAAYGKNGVHRLLRDIIALANASIDGNRYLIIGVEIDGNENRTVHPVDPQEVSGKPSFESLVAEFVEPPIRFEYQPLTVEGKQIGILEIFDCQDQPYMMRADFSEELRRGDAYIRIENTSVKLGRRQLQAMFERKFQSSMSSQFIEIGFPGEIIHKNLRVPTVDLSQMPSAIERAKLSELIDIKQSSQGSGSTSGLARLTHARLFGADNPYEDRTPTTLLQEESETSQKYEDDDRYFLFETNAQKLQMVIFNQGDQAIENASLSLLMPHHEAFYVANCLPKILRNDEFVDRSPVELADYPSVVLKNNTVRVSCTLGDIAPGAPLEIFERPLRICVGSELQGRRLGIRYELSGSNLRQPAKGKLKLLF